jgi:dolichol-phosphate mannosyltransferase
MFRFAFDAIFSFSIIPLRIATMTGFVVMAGSIMLVARTLYLRFISDTVIPGFTALYVVILMLGGLNLIVLGIVGEYMGRMYVEIKGRPLYFIEGVYSSEKKETHVWA